ncbi:MAG TPA: 30S ribosomal protein S20 [Caldisericia bacterium]|jgi:small subunit ribosomal protein S20|nr:MAG: 30S ribosomal protein S20 [bacterium ADurb.Bin132]HNY60829.1 30S ribosomal protein S20 [Caldisericia bacterium]HOC79070.1 30S ribosomal protein S20 [Caldisericia bacterium]HOG69870.1 30S ribosomal protein S20 [Caldisericia bacterium]HPA65355.1 30S ribosomal protein S20 [Caldisericia bacterium]
MLRHKAQQKSVRQSAKRHERNVTQKSAAKTAIKKAIASIGTGEATTSVQIAIKSLDKLESHGIMHKNAVARKKSRLMAKLNKSLQQA